MSADEIIPLRGEAFELLRDRAEHTNGRAFLEAATAWLKPRRDDDEASPDHWATVIAAVVRSRGPFVRTLEAEMQRLGAGADKARVDERMVELRELLRRDVAQLVREAGGGA